MLRKCFDKHGCDKGSARHKYDEFYEPLFAPIRNERLRLLEIGIFRGASIAAWLEYFPNAEIIGVDTFERVSPNSVPVLVNPRVTYWACDSTALAPSIEKVDIIIDDGSHKPASQAATLSNYWPLLKDGGMYFIEDILDLSTMTGIHPVSLYKGAAGEWLARL